MEKVGKTATDKWDDLQERTLASLRTETSPVKKEEPLTPAPVNSKELTEEGLNYLAKISDRQLSPDYEPENPHEAMAIDLIRAALSGDKTARKTYWDLQQRIYSANAKTRTPNVQIEIKKDIALSQALDNIQAKVMEGEITK